VFIFAVSERTSSSFYATAGAVLFGLLITWLVAEARGLREDLIAKFEGGSAASRLTRIPGATLLVVAVGLTVGALIALRVEFRGKAESWEEIVVWAALGAGFVGVVFSVVTNVLETNEITRREVPLRALRIAKRWAPAVVALICGLLASPLFEKKHVRFVGAKFAVYGTCLAGGCNLKQRRGPGVNYPEVNRRERLGDGELVLVVCQAKGRAPKGFSNRIWDRLPNGRYVSDAFVNTPNRQGGFSSGLPHCNTRAAQGTAG
jgi:hypothetical protein